jgi:hypothetical protein
MDSSANTSNITIKLNMMYNNVTGEWLDTKFLFFVDVLWDSRKESLVP